MLLPGGICEDGGCRRDYAFKPITGALELALAEISARSSTALPAHVTAILGEVLEHLGETPPSEARVAALSIGDRQFLMRQLAVSLGMDAVWLSAACAACGIDFDFLVRQSEMPVKEASEGYPFVIATTSAGPCRLRVPSGADQQAVASIADDSLAVRTLLGRCLVGIERPTGPEPAPGLVEVMDDEDLAVMESALEDVAPEISLAVQASCPECEHVNTIGLDPYLCMGSNADELFLEVHALAMTYHWSEQEILALRKTRRARYLGLVEQPREFRQ